MQKALISFFAIPIVFAHLMGKGALLHNLVAYPMNECNVFGSFKFSMVTLMVFLVSVPRSLFPIVRGWFKMFEAFHISVSLIWACNWLTESIRSFSSIEAMLTLSLILTFCTQVFNYKILSVLLKFCLLEIIDCCKSAFLSFQFFGVVFCKILRYCNSFFLLSVSVH